MLLLLITGGVILRSLSLRIQGRRRIEEAIRNGTYVPPANSPVNITNAVKPAFYEAHVKNRDNEEKDWYWHRMQVCIDIASCTLAFSCQLSSLWPLPSLLPFHLYPHVQK